MKVDWHQYQAAIWRGYDAKLKPIKRWDKVDFAALQGIDQQKSVLLDNTQQFVQGNASNHALLWGARGTGKSSLVKAMLTLLAEQGLRMIQIDKDDLAILPSLLDCLEEETECRFIIFCDDLSFEAGDASYKPLKSVLEGGLALPPDNVRLYATSNRRHLLPEHQSENQASHVVDGEVHYADSLEDKLALSDRFGLTLSFYPADWAHYFAIVDNLFNEIVIEQSLLHDQAKQFAMSRGSHNGRTAKQFYHYYAANLKLS